MKKFKMICPVCGKVNEFERYSEYYWGTVEQHYYCDRCTYFVEQVYSPVLDAEKTSANKAVDYHNKLYPDDIWKVRRCLIVEDVPDK